MTLWLTAVMPTLRPASTQATIIRAPVYVFPAPGGPWMARSERSRERTVRLAKSTGSSPFDGPNAPFFRRGGLPRRRSRAADFGVKPFFAMSAARLMREATISFEEM